MGDKQNNFSFLDKLKAKASKNIKTNKKIFWYTFWTVFIGSSVFVAIPLWLKALFEKPSKGPKYQVKLIKKVEHIEPLKYLEEKKDAILAKAWERSKPQIGNLRKEITAEVSNYTKEKLDEYFSVIETQNVDRFLDWVYSFGTDYKIAFFTGKEEVDKLLSTKECLNNLPDCKKLIKPSGYLEKQVNKYLLNSEDLKAFLKREVLPYHRKKLNEFVNKSSQILEYEIKKTALEELKKKFPKLQKGILEATVTQFTEQIKPELEKDALGRITAKVIAMVSLKILAKSAVKITMMLPKKITSKLAAKLIEKLAAEMAAKAGSKLAGAGSGFATGTALCLEFGPFAVLCGAAAAVVASVATDYAINKLDELISRDDFKKELVAYLEEAKAELYSGLMENFQNSIRNIEAQMENSCDKKEKLKDLVS